MLDLVVRGGRIVDGTGRAAYSEDIGIAHGRIVALGGALGRARRVIEADGQLVTPGWVDTHSHMDGQATWDSYCSPAVDHGITTLVMGNCGVGFAPCARTAAAHQQMIEVMEDVEDIPGTALHEGLSWDWESFPEYLDALDRKPRAIDIAAQVPHCAVRTYIMGERSIANEPATDEDIAKMIDVVREGLQAGAVGFTTSRTRLHVTRHGQAMPGTYADGPELRALAGAVAEHGRRKLFGVICDFEDWRAEMDWLKSLAQGTGCQVNFVLFYRHDADWPRILEQLDYLRGAHAIGARMFAHVGARPVNVLMGWNTTLHPFKFHSSFAAIANLALQERVAALRDPLVRARILSEKPPAFGNDGLSQVAEKCANGFDQIYVIGDVPDYEPRYESSIESLARNAGVNPQEYAYDVMMRDEGRGMLYCPLFGYDRRSLDRQIRMLLDEYSIVSLADTGAHCRALCDASTPTYLISDLVRKRKTEGLSLEAAVRLHTRDTARCMGFVDRGTIELGMKADLNVIDYEQLQVLPPVVRNDFPAGGARIYQGARGYAATLVAGEVVMAGGEPTGALPGRLVRA
jgi:N-acyl-D-aspartate/D-glutamate deacylase